MKTGELIERNLGEHLALAVAAHLARSQLLADPLKPYDAQHLGEQLDFVARALAKAAPLYAKDARTGEPRELLFADLEGAQVKRAATVLLLRDGRKLCSVTMKRADLRQAIAILRLTGVPELGAPPAPPGWSACGRR